MIMEDKLGVYMSTEIFGTMNILQDMIMVSITTNDGTQSEHYLGSRLRMLEREDYQTHSLMDDQM